MVDSQRPSAAQSQSKLYQSIDSAVSGGAVAVRVSAKLEPIAGGDKILPPTYAPEKGDGGRHNTTPLENGRAAWVSVDAPASFANRVEAALVGADLNLDPLRTEVNRITYSTMQLPHRAFDAGIRESSIDGIPFRKTEIGQSVIAATPRNAEALLRYDPSVLLLGGWDSTELGQAGGIGNKWPAALSVEIVATDVMPIGRAGSRIDPMGVEGTAQNIVIEADGSMSMATEDSLTRVEAAKKAKSEYPRLAKPSEVNLGNVTPTITPKGVVVGGEIVLRGAISLTRLRRYRFGEVDANSARTFLALMGVYGIAAVLADGLDLRRDCELVPTQVQWSLVGADGADALSFTLEEAREALAFARSTVPVSEPVVMVAGKALASLAKRAV